MKKAIVLFDGECHFCNGAVQFIIKRDRKGFFQFASLQSEIGQQLLLKYDVDRKIDSIVVIADKRVYIKSAAALRIGKDLDGAWKALSILNIVPKFLRNLAYDWVAKNRYRWFGKQEVCKIPSEEERKRFL